MRVTSQAPQACLPLSALQTKSAAQTARSSCFAQTGGLAVTSNTRVCTLCGIGRRHERGQCVGKSAVTALCSFASKLLSAHARQCGSKYLHTVLGPAVGRVVATDRGHPFEVEPHRLADCTALGVNQDALVSFASEVLHVLTSSFPGTP